MQLGANFAGTAIENSMLGATHACANPLTAHYGLTHGIAIGILLPHVIRFNARSVGTMYADLVQASTQNHDVGGSNGDLMHAAELLAQRIVELVKVSKLPTTLSNAGVSKSILHLLAEEDGQSIHRVAKRLGLGMSELQRLLAALGNDPRFDGLDLVAQHRDGERLRLWLTDKGRRLCGLA